jgi:hypothetical protein
LDKDAGSRFSQFINVTNRKMTAKTTTKSATYATHGLIALRGSRRRSSRARLDYRACSTEIAGGLPRVETARISVGAMARKLLDYGSPGEYAGPAKFHIGYEIVYCFQDIASQLCRVLLQSCLGGERPRARGCNHL